LPGPWLLAEYEIKSEVRKSVAGLAVPLGVPGVHLWVFVSFTGRYFSWGHAQNQHPVRDLAGAARRIATDVRNAQNPMGAEGR
jgi:hypothetical protein